MPDTGITGKPEETGTRESSVAIVADNDIQTLSFASCPTCPGPRRTPTLHVGCTSRDTIQGGKDTDAEIEDKLNASSSSPEPAQEDEAWQTCSYPLCKFQRQLSLEDPSEKERPIVEVVEVTPNQGMAQVVLAASFNPSPSTPVLKSKRKAEADAEDGLVSSVKKNQKPAGISKADKVADDKTASEKFWAQREQITFKDPPDSSGRLGPCMKILADLSLGTAEPTDMQLVDGEPQGTAVYVPPFATAITAGFCCDFAGGGISPFTDEHLINDPDRVGLDGLNILLRVDFGERPTFMDQEQI